MGLAMQGTEAVRRQADGTWLFAVDSLFSPG